MLYILTAQRPRAGFTPHAWCPRFHTACALVPCKSTDLIHTVQIQRLFPMLHCGPSWLLGFKPEASHVNEWIQLYSGLCLDFCDAWRTQCERDVGSEELSVDRV